MNRFELHAALTEAGLDRHYYGIDTPDLVSFAFLPEAVPILVRGTDGRWNVDYHERGTHRQEKTFATEDEACQYVYDTAMRDWQSYQRNLAAQKHASESG